MVKTKWIFWGIFPKIIIVFFLLSINKISASEIYQWDEAHNHIGETVTVEGVFKYTNNIGNICFLNFHPNFEKYISVLIFKEYFLIKGII